MVIAYVKEITFGRQTCIQHRRQERMTQTLVPGEELHQTRSVGGEIALCDYLDDNFISAKLLIGGNERCTRAALAQNSNGLKPPG
jgi:hypothetical protein